MSATSSRDVVGGQAERRANHLRTVHEQRHRTPEPASDGRLHAGVGNVQRGGRDARARPSLWRGRREVARTRDAWRVGEQLAETTTPAPLTCSRLSKSTSRLTLRRWSKNVGGARLSPGIPRLSAMVVHMTSAVLDRRQRTRSRRRRRGRRLEELGNGDGQSRLPVPPGPVNVTSRTPALAQLRRDLGELTVPSDESESETGEGWSAFRGSCSGGKSCCRSSATSWKMCSGSGMSLSRCQPRSFRCRPSRGLRRGAAPCRRRRRPDRRAPMRRAGRRGAHPSRRSRRRAGSAHRCADPIRTRTVTPPGQAYAAEPRWAASAARDGVPDGTRRRRRSCHRRSRSRDRASASNLLAHDGALDRQRFAVLHTELAQQPRRTFDVAEQQGELRR